MPDSYQTTVDGSTMGTLRFAVRGPTGSLVLLASGTISVARPPATAGAKPIPFLTDVAVELEPGALVAFWRPVWGGGAGQMPAITRPGTPFVVRFRVLDTLGRVHKSGWKPWTVDP